MCARRDQANSSPKGSAPAKGGGPLVAWQDLMDRLEDRGRWQKPAFLAALAIAPLVVGGTLYSLWPKPEANNTWVYISSEALNRAIEHELVGGVAGRDLLINVCNAPRSSRPVMDLNGVRFEFEKTYPWEGFTCRSLRVVSPNGKGEVIASDIPGRLIALRKHRESVGKDGSGKPLNWKVVDARNDAVLAQGEVKMDGVKPISEAPGIPRINMGGGWYLGRTMQLIDYWTMKPEIQSTFYTKDSVPQTVFVPSNTSISALPFELGPDGKLLVANWGRTPACTPIPGQLIDYIYTNKARKELRILNIYNLELPAFTSGTECR